MNASQAQESLIALRYFLLKFSNIRDEPRVKELDKVIDFLTESKDNLDSEKNNDVYG